MRDVDSANDEKETKTTSGASASKSTFDAVVVHPLVLLSVVDHFKRVDEVINSLFFFLFCFPTFCDLILMMMMMMMMSISLFLSLCVCVCVLSSAMFLSMFSLSFSF